MMANEDGGGVTVDEINVILEAAGTLEPSAGRQAKLLMSALAAVCIGSGVQQAKVLRAFKQAWGEVEDIGIEKTPVDKIGSC